MEKRKITFSPPDITDREIAEVVDTLKSGWITTGPKTKKFEEEIAKYCGVKKSVCLNSATAAMELALRLFDIGEGDEVITSAYTYTASASVIYHCGAKIVLADTKEGEFNIDPKEIEKLISPKTKAIIAIDIGGLPADYSEILNIVENKKSIFNPKKNTYQEKLGRILIIGDAAHSFGSSYKEKKIGSVADITSFSFHAVKNLTTGEGGALTWNLPNNFDNEQIYKELMLLSLHGQNKDALSKLKAGAWKYDITIPAYKCNMTDIIASIGLVQLQRYDNEILKKKQELVSYYEKYLRDLVNKIELPIFKNNIKESCRHLYMIRLKNQDEGKRNEIIAKLGENDIATNVHFQPLPLLTAYKNLGFQIENYPNAYNQYKNEISLPLHDFLSEDDVKYICEYIKKLI
ncbi:DegT/DnrJ/EryC1/StrS family aminotransferase [Fusobacterium hwasookii]|uniref:Capsular biosynthesis protein n=1 Tax=Fusobacterium hwasookii ChDC F206 TaxID=1307443 RepID=A0AAC8WJH2_9FUSO|nr:DegT/DnrJ/EryC1/StrS aminotransferase family protein [Fusobacterium hwasookii]ALQ34847.1 capsular biosynthesis protein [Fusobacterium hwasookii ChDC F206]ALQ38731.1 capsular biosynthesis protein [Fusobacterium hwasookii ChDC F300]